MTNPIRIALRRTLLPRLRPGSRIPPARIIGRAVGLSHVAAWRHMRAVFEEAGVETWWCREFGCLVVSRVRE